MNPLLLEELSGIILAIINILCLATGMAFRISSQLERIPLTGLCWGGWISFSDNTSAFTPLCHNLCC